MLKTKKPEFIRAAEEVLAELEHEDELSPRHRRFAEAYVAMMRGARYRPQAPSDGFGNISLTSAELADPERLFHEAVAYARRFGKEDDARMFNLGCSSFSTNRASVFVVEAARQLAGGTFGAATVLPLLQMAIDEFKRAQRERADL